MSLTLTRHISTRQAAITTRSIDLNQLPAVRAKRIERGEGLRRGPEQVVRSRVLWIPGFLSSHLRKKAFDPGMTF